MYFISPRGVCEKESWVSPRPSSTSERNICLSFSLWRWGSTNSFSVISIPASERHSIISAFFRIGNRYTVLLVVMSIVSVVAWIVAVACPGAVSGSGIIVSYDEELDLITIRCSGSRIVGSWKKKATVFPDLNNNIQYWKFGGNTKEPRETTKLVKYSDNILMP